MNGNQRRVVRGRMACAVLARWSLVVLIACAMAGESRGSIIVVARKGEDAPVGDGRYFFFGFPQVNESGEIAFVSLLSHATDGTGSGIYRGTSTPGSVVELVREGQVAPGGSETFQSFEDRDFLFNDLGQAAFFGFLRDSNGPFATFGIFRGQGGAITQIVRPGQAAPGESGDNGQFSGISPRLVFNNVGQVAFSADLTNTTGGGNDDFGIFRGEGATITQVVREGQILSGGSEKIFQVGLGAINDGGQAVFYAVLVDGDNHFVFDGKFRGSGGVNTEIVRRGQVVPGGTKLITGFGGTVATNASGQVVFLGITNDGGNISDDIYRGSGGAITEIAHQGQDAPDGNGKFASLFFLPLPPAINDSGDVAFFAQIFSETSGGSNEDFGIYRSEGGVLLKIAREGQMAPDGNGEFDFFPVQHGLSLNSLGQSAFKAFLRNTAGGASDDEGIFIGDGIDLVQIARAGQGFRGSTFFELFIDQKNALNNAGQVAFKYTLNNDVEEQGVALWTPPEVHWTAGDGVWEPSGNWLDGLTPTSLYDVFLDPLGTGLNSIQITGSVTEEFVKSLTVGANTGVGVVLNQNLADFTSLSNVMVKPTGVINIDGGIVFTVRGTLMNGGHVLMDSGVLDAETIVFGTGIDVLLVTGGTLRARTINLGSGIFHFEGGRLQVESFNGDLVNQGGVLAPGSSPGTTTINGSYTQMANGVLEIEIGGITEDTYDRVDVVGDLVIGGGMTIDVNLIGMNLPMFDGPLFVPVAGDEFEVLSWQSLIGDVAKVNFDFSGALLSPGLAWQRLWGPTTNGSLFLKVEAVPEPGSLLVVVVWMAGAMTLRKRRMN